MKLTTSQLWQIVRRTRDSYLAATDKYMLSDFPLDTKSRTRFKDYRQYLRDVPALYDDKTIQKAKVKNFNEWLEWKQGGEY